MPGTRPQRPPVRLGECRDCAMPVAWVQLDTGNSMPVNPMPNPEGNVSCRLIGGKLHGFVISKDHPHDGVSLLMRPHAATCEAKRRPKVEAEPDPSLF